jgi:dsRNA-specific ribonuclease
VNDKELYSKPIQTNSDLFLRDVSFIMQDALVQSMLLTFPSSSSSLTITGNQASQSEQDRNKMLMYALRPCSLSDTQRKVLIIHNSNDHNPSYLSKQILNNRQVNLVKQWLKTVPSLAEIFTEDLIDPHLVKCFVTRTMLKKRERNVIYEFNRSNMQLEMQGMALLECIVSSYLHEFQSSFSTSDNNEQQMMMTSGENILHIQELLLSDHILYYFAQSIGLNDHLLSHFQDIPQQRTGVDILAAIIGQVNNLIGMEKSSVFWKQFMLPKLFSILEEHPVPQIKTEELVRSLSHQLYNQNPVKQTREYNLKKHGLLYSTLILCSKQIKGQGLAVTEEQSANIAWRNAYEQLKSESTSQ